MCNCYKQKFLKCNEKVLFTGSYNLDNVYRTTNTSTLLMNISKNQQGQNIRVIEFYVITPDNETPNILSEEYNIHSYDLNSLSMGEIQLTSTYINDTSSPVSQAGLFNLNTTSSNGIYKNVTRVVLDTNNTIRQLYFIGKKC